MMSKEHKEMVINGKEYRVWEDANTTNWIRRSGFCISSNCQIESE